MSTTTNFAAFDVITEMFDIIGVYQAGSVIAPADVQVSYRRLNRMINGWQTLPLTFPVVVRETFTTTANQSTYSIGPGGDFDTTRPTKLTGSGCLLPDTGSGQRVEISRPLITDDAYEAIPIKDLPTGWNGQWTEAYFNPTFASGLASLFLWPTPSTAQNDCVIYRGTETPEFVSLNATADYPPGYFDAFAYNLAQRSLAPYAISDQQVRGDVNEGALRYLRMIKVQNMKPADLMIDPAMTKDWRGGYNILVGGN